MRLLAVDPGNEQSALVLYSAGRVLDHAIVPNDDLLAKLRAFERAPAEFVPSACVVEMIASYGMAVGAEVFETCVMIGSVCEAWLRSTNIRAHRLPRMTVKMHLCHNARAKDANIRAALLDRFGGKDAAVGSKKTPGPLYGIKADEWAALALAVTYHDRLLGADAGAA